MNTVQMTIKIDKELRDAFVAVAKSCESDASKELRKFMKEFIRKNGQRELFK